MNARLGVLVERLRSLEPRCAQLSAALVVMVCGCTPTAFQTTLGSPGYDQPLGISPTGDGGYAVCSVRLAPTESVWMTKLDATGAIDWERSPVTPASGLRGGCFETPQGLKLVTSTEMENENDQIVLWTLDAAGDDVSDVRVDTAADEIAIAAAASADGHVVITGWYQDRSALGVRVLLTEVDPSGARLWSAAVDHAGNQRGEDVIRLATGGFLVVGNAGIGSTATASPFAERVDAGGTPLWQRTYADLGVGSLDAVVQRADGTILAGGRRGSSSPTGLLMALDGEGDVLWTNDYASGVRMIEDLIALVDGSVVAAGTWNDGAGADDAFLAKLDANGDAVWIQHYGGAAVEYALDASATPDGGYVLAGGTDSFGEGDKDVYVVKTDASGVTGAPPS